MKPLYNSKELAKIYNRIKIQYNPSGYSFRDRLIEVENKRNNYSNSMDNISYETEDYLLSKITSFWKKPPKLIPYRTFNIPESDFDILVTSLRTLAANTNYIYNLHSCTFIRSDNLYFVPNYISDNIGCIDFKKSKIIDILAIPLYLLTTNKSVCSNLKWATTSMSEKFESLDTLQFLKEELVSKADTLHVNHCDTFFDTTLVPVPVKEGLACPAENFATLTGIDTSKVDVSHLDKDDKDALEKFVQLRYLETILFGIELVYLINRYTEPYVNRQLYELLTGSMKSSSNIITKLIYKEGIDTFEPVIDLDEDIPERFRQLDHYIRSPEVLTTVDKVTENFINNHGYIPVPSLFGAMLSCGMDYSVRMIRTKQCAILYNYCSTNKLLSDPALLDELMERSPFKDVFKSLDSGEISEDLEEKPSRRGMLDIKDRKPEGGKPGGSHDSSSVSQALDGLINNFRTEKYKFTVKDVYSDNDAAKAEYDAIVSKIKLVNTRLIKQIREIKTYNVGGKYSGLTSGRIDRKNIHKYKTDKNIFYQNTYKQKECDLAFGIVLDASGSMSGQGIVDGRTTMIVLHETLKALGINHSIIDHTCYGSSYSSDLRRYQCFKEDKGYKLRKNYALASIKAESGNCDSGALWFMEKALLRTKNKDKICLIFSDGAPTECSGTDLVEQVRHMEKHGIKVIGIGVNFSSISKYYTNYANGRNLKEMLDIVADILKEYVLSKKD